MKAEPVPVGARVIDSLPFSLGGSADALAGHVDGIVGYLGAMKPSLVDACRVASMGVMAVTYGGAFDGPTAVKQLGALGLPAGSTVFVDLEGHAVFQANPLATIETLDDWAMTVQDAGYIAGLYVGAPQPLTSGELTRLAVTRYWKGQGRCVDRFGRLAEPESGWCMVQAYPSIYIGGVKVDANLITQDYQGRVPTWAKDV